jgi:hypothetical protein
MRRAILPVLSAGPGAALLFTLLPGCPPPVVPPPPAGVLTLSLDPALNADDTVIATSIRTADLLDGAGKVVVTGTPAGPSATFDVAGLAAGDYFIRINGLVNDLVPTRIDDPAAATSQLTAQTLRASVIGDPNAPTYRIKTFSKGQGEHPIVRYSDGTNVSPFEYAYTLLALQTSPQEFTVRVLGTGTQVSSFTSASGAHPGHGDFAQPFGTWTVDIQSPLPHGPAYAGLDANCTGCHGNLDNKPPFFPGFSVANGFCYRCHYGKTGDSNGFIDPNR